MAGYLGGIEGWRLVRELDELIPNGGFEQLSRITDANFLHHRGAMRFDCLDADGEPRRDLAIRQPLPNQFQNLLLTRLQWLLLA